jgi:ABC-2 type transport system ATP-binding protein
MIDVHELTKRYGDRVVLDRVTFHCPPATVTGFLGPNGAGKSTVMRILVGLATATSGSATIDGRRYRDIPNPATRIGILLDASAQHAGRTGREVLAMSALALGLPRSRVEQMLATVGLRPEESRRRIRGYSLGMRQRLGLAHALLGNPDVLILDEPANGLDPAGIRWMRDLLRQYAADGGTVLLASHLLPEVEAVADRFVLIGEGRILAQGTKNELLDDRRTFVRATPQRSLTSAMDNAGLTWTRHDDGLLIDTDAHRLWPLLPDGVVIDELRPASGTGLEDLFLRITAQTQRDTQRSGAPA